MQLSAAEKRRQVVPLFKLPSTETESFCCNECQRGLFLLDTVSDANPERARLASYFVEFAITEMLNEFKLGFYCER